jgi:Zn-dependent metalloprotease
MAALRAAEDQAHHDLDQQLRLLEEHINVNRKLADPATRRYGHLSRSIYTCHNGTKLPGDLLRHEGQGPVSDSTANECYDAFGSTFTFYNEIFNRDSVDNAGLRLLGSLHYSQRYNNAFWNGRQMVFGDGDGIYFNRFTESVDIIGHELTHGVVQYTCNLEYQDEAGALNESLADCFGSMVKQYAVKQTSEQADWLIGEGIFTSKVKGRALRSMKAPGTAYDDPHLGKDPQPDHYSKLLVTKDDAGGVHTNSGIPNHAFYLVCIALGGHSWDRAGRIWYTTMTDRRLKGSANFKDFAKLTIENAGKLYDDKVSHAVAQAWSQVGVVP